MAPPSNRVLRREAVDAARAAASRGFLEEYSAWTLQHRCVIAALRVLAEHGGTHEALVAGWLPDGRGVGEFDFTSLPPDAVVADFSEPWPNQVDELLDDRVPLPDDGWDQEWRRCGLRFRTVLHGVDRRGDDFLVSRLTLRAMDRWFYYWDGSYQDEIYALSDPTPAGRATRAAVTLDWARICIENFEVAAIVVDAEERTVRRVADLVLSECPDALVTRR